MKWLNRSRTTSPRKNLPAPSKRRIQLSRFPARWAPLAKVWFAISSITICSTALATTSNLMLKIMVATKASLRFLIQRTTQSCTKTRWNSSSNSYTLAIQPQWHGFLKSFTSFQLSSNQKNKRMKRRSSKTIMMYLTHCWNQPPRLFRTLLALKVTTMITVSVESHSAQPSTKWSRDMNSWKTSTK